MVNTTKAKYKNILILDFLYLFFNNEEDLYYKRIKKRIVRLKKIYTEDEYSYNIFDGIDENNKYYISITLSHIKKLTTSKILCYHFKNEVRTSDCKDLFIEKTAEEASYLRKEIVKILRLEEKIEKYT